MTVSVCTDYDEGRQTSLHHVIVSVMKVVRLNEKMKDRVDVEGLETRFLFPVIVIVAADVTPRYDSEGPSLSKQ